MIYVIAPSIWRLIDLPWMSTSIFQPTRLALCSAPSYNTPPCEAPMPFLKPRELRLQRGLEIL